MDGDSQNVSTKKSTSEYSKRNSVSKEKEVKLSEKRAFINCLEKVKTIIHKFPAICPENGQKQLRAKSDAIMGCLRSIL